MTPEEQERRAPGWVSRCLTCGLTEPYGRRGIRIAASGTPRRLFKCSRCGRFRCHIVEQRHKGNAPDDRTSPAA